MGTDDTFNHGERSGFIERLGRLAGKTTWREPDGSDRAPYVASTLSADNAMLLALSMSRRNARDVGPEVAYSVGTGTPHQQQRVVCWLADKLMTGTGHAGRRNQKHLGEIARQAYELVIGTRSHFDAPATASRDFVLLANIGAGWLWMAMESAVERAERAMYDEPRRRRLRLTSRG
jgi:hypothetical protein